MLGLISTDMTCTHVFSVGYDGFQWQHHFVPFPSKIPFYYYILSGHPFLFPIAKTLNTARNNCMMDFVIKSRTSHTYPHRCQAPTSQPWRIIGKLNYTPPHTKGYLPIRWGRKKCFANSTIGRHLTTFQQEAPSLNYTSPAFKTKILLSSPRRSDWLLMSCSCESLPQVFSNVS